MATTRREFIKRFSAFAGCYVATASVATLPGCTTTAVPPTGSRFSFPQGVASADPHPDAVVLWTRALDTSGDAPVQLIAQVSESEDFNRVVLETPVASEPLLDHTLRLFVQGLKPNRWYWYRFVAADGTASVTGRTCTAPAPDAEEPLRLAMFSCQSFENGYFNAYRRVIVDDTKRPLNQQTRLMVHVGDWYYENVGGTMTADGDYEAQPNWPDGTPHNNANIPSGAEGRRPYAKTLADFRHLHRSNLSDAAMIEARRLYPFVYVWDDHEVRNDYWQGYDNAGAAQTNKLDSNQAWFEYCPAALSRAAAGPAGYNPAKDFVPTSVENADATVFDENYLSLEENNLKAIYSLTIYRTLSWGKTADLILVDGRSYRGQRGMDDSILGSEAVAYPNQPIPADLVDILAEGRDYNNGNPPETVTYQGVETPNPRRDSPATTMLGAAQKSWLKATLLNSKARWKVLCNNVPMMRFNFDSSYMEHGVIDGIFFSDSWDGYPNERRELMKFIRDNDISGVISLTGDRHAHYAGVVYDDHGSDNPFPVMAELVGASISAACRQVLQARLSSSDPFFQQIADADALESENYLYYKLPALNYWMLYGADTAKEYNQSRNAERALALANYKVNPQLSYADNDAYGFFRVEMSADNCAAEFVTEPQPVINHTEADEPPVRRRIRVNVPYYEAGQPAQLTDWEVEGEAPLLGLKI